MEKNSITPINKDRLQTVMQFVKEHADFNEINYKKLHAKLQEEYNIEWRRLSDRAENPYLNNLHQTIEKQTNDYLNARKKDKAYPFKLFVEAFEEDVRDAMRAQHIRYYSTYGTTLVTTCLKAPSASWRTGSLSFGFHLRQDLCLRALTLKLWRKRLKLRRHADGGQCPQDVY
jgi:hypothetical protein